MATGQKSQRLGRDVAVIGIGHHGLCERIRIFEFLPWKGLCNCWDPSDPGCRSRIWSEPTETRGTD